MSSGKGSPDVDTSPAWSTGPNQIEVKLVMSGKTYNVDTDIAKRMGITQEGHETEPPFKLGNCDEHDFERALAFCAQDRSCSDPPSTELTHIIQETARSEPSPTPETIQISFANINLADDQEDEEDESYVPSESESSESDEDYSDTDIGTANIEAENEEYLAREKEKEKEKEKQQLGV
ncbi:hypothetical protein ACGC1H_007304 [Rhizoctonia solani]|uniref:Uncharacterized protein n=1 Tax=Rhizoctonia solani TaxID=456999 RepID=A0A8H3BNI1_9AGAM|nr:unnamed protein product [Rhizoctonia solani]